MDSLSDLQDSYLLCRDLRHAWRQHQAYVTKRWRSNPTEVRRVLLCTRCGSERHELFHLPSWVRIKVNYHHAEDYLLRGVGAVTGSDVRTELFSRITISEEEPA